MRRALTVLAVFLVAGLAGAPALYAADGLPLVDAVKNGDTDAVRALLKRGTDVNAAAPDGATALHWAAINGHRDTFELLVSRGASLTIRDQRFNGTPEDWARELQRSTKDIK